MKKRAASFFRKILNSALMFFGIGTVAAEELIESVEIRQAVCLYGMPPNIREEFVGTVSGDIDGDGTIKGIPGIKYYFEDEPENSRLTRKDGTFTCKERSLRRRPRTMVFEDVDGEKNGTFKTKKITLSPRNSDVILEREEPNEEE